jgi:transketolase
MTGDEPVNNAAAAARPTLTVIMPARNEEATLPRAYEEVTAVMAGLPCDYEVIVIDNASTDRTGEVAAELCARDRRWRYARFSRNFHVESSITAGLRLASGDAALILFSDLQDPPQLIPEFVRRWQEGDDVVYGVLRKREGDPWWKSLGARTLYRLVNQLGEVDITPNATDFRLLSRRAIDALNRFDERNRYLRGLAHWIGFRRSAIVYDRRPRTAGRSKAPFFYMLNLAANAITSFSIKPLQFFSMAGMVALAGAVGLALVYLGSYLLGITIPGLTTIYLLALANLAVLLLGFGTLGEYIGRIYVEAKGRPLFLIDRTINLDMPATAVPPAEKPKLRVLPAPEPPAPLPKRRRFLPAELRKCILRMAHSGSTVHVPCALSLVEIFAVLYRSHLRMGAGTPRSPGRDYLVLSKGHGVMAQYACLHELGWLSDSHIVQYFRDGTLLKGLADAHVPGVEASSGSLGHGLSVAVGLALAAQRKGTGQRVYAVVGDGEMNEGSVWEAILFASHFQLANLMIIVDENGYQAMGTTREVMDLGRLAEKLTTFGLETREVDGHDEAAIDATVTELWRSSSRRPRALVARTVKGRGVSFMENNNRWHYTRLTPDTFAAAMSELEGRA